MSDTGDQETLQWYNKEDLKFLHFKFSLCLLPPPPCFLFSAAASDEDETDHKPRRLDSIGDQANSVGK